MVAVWLAICAALTAGPFRTHIEYFGERLGAPFQWAILATVLALAAWAAVYVRLRRSGLWRREPLILASMALAFLLWAAPWGTVAAALLGAGCYGAGAAALERFGFDVPSTTARIGLASAVGLGGLAVLLIPVGLAGLYGPLTFWAMLALWAAIGRRHLPALPGLVRELNRRWQGADALRSPLVGVAVAFAPAFLAAFLAAAAAPTIAYDPVSHHLPAARHYLEGGLLEPLPLLEGAFQGQVLFTLGHSVAYSYYPQTFEELLAFAWGLGGQSAAQLVSPLTCGLSMLLVIAVARLCGVSLLGCVLGAAAGLTLPFAHWVGAISKNDFPLALFQLGALYCVLRARQGGAGRWLILGSAMLGLSFGVKHTALFLCIPLGLLMLWELRRAVKPFRLAVGMAAIFFSAGFFWHARTYAMTGNPLFPATADRGTLTVPAIDGTQPSRWTVHIQYPWYLHFDGIKVMEGPTNSPAGFFLLFFGPLWWMVRSRRSAAEGAVLFALLVFYLYWAYIWGVLRYGLAPALLLCALIGGRLAALSRASVWLDRLTAGGLAYCLAFALLPVLMLEVNAPQLAYLAGRLDRDAYLREAMADYGAIEFLNERRQPDDRVVAVNNCSAAYAADPARFRCMRYDYLFLPPIVEMISTAVTAARPDYLVLPADERGELVLDALGEGAFGPPLYEDATFRVHARASAP